MNVSNLRRNSVNIALTNYVIKQLKSIYTPVYSWSAFIRPIEMISITLVYICYIFSYKWNKENIIITFRSYVRSMLGSCVRLTFSR